MASLRSAVSRCCTLEVPWTAEDVAVIGNADVHGAKVYLAALVKAGVVVRQGDTYRAGCRRIVAAWRTESQKIMQKRREKRMYGADTYGHSAAYKAGRAAWDALVEAENQARKAGALTSQDLAGPSKCEHSEAAPTEEPMPATIEPMVTPNQAAETLALSVFTIHRWCKAGKFPGARKLGRTWRIPITSIQNIGNQPEKT